MGHPYYMGAWNPLSVCGALCSKSGCRFYSLLPDFSNGISVPSMAPTFMKMDFAGVFSLDFIVIMFAFLFVDMFDTLGTLIGVASKANMLDKDGKLPKIKGALLSDAVGTTVGAMCGTSTVTTFVESASGVAEGGRTGLTSTCFRLLFVRTFPVPFPDLPGDSFLRHSSGSDRGWIPYADLCYQDRL